MRLTAGVPLGFAVGAVLCRLWLAHPSQTLSWALTQPLPVVTYWHGAGAPMWLSLAVAVAFAAVPYALTIRRLLMEHTDRAPAALAAICAASFLGGMAALAFPVVFSSDVYAYAAYGAMQLHGIDPYAHVHLPLRDPLLIAAVHQWGNPPPVCVYGPAFVWIAQAIVALLAHAGVAAQLFAFRLLSCVALTACGPLAYAAMGGLPRASRLAAAAGIEWLILQRKGTFQLSGHPSHRECERIVHDKAVSKDDFSFERGWDPR